MRCDRQWTRWRCACVSRWMDLSESECRPNSTVRKKRTARRCNYDMLHSKKCARCVCVDDDDDHARYHQRKWWLTYTSSTFFISSIFKYEIESFCFCLLIVINQNRSHYRLFASSDRNSLRDETKKKNFN